MTSYQIQAQNLSIGEIRTEIEKATFDEQVAENLAKTLESQNPDNALLIAFRASAEGIIAMHNQNPLKRIKHVKQAVQLANEAVSKDEENLEIRFIRFAIQSQIPKMLGLSKNVTEDQVYLAQNFNQSHFNTIPYHSLEEMVHVLEESNRFTTKDIISMRKEVYSHKK